MEKILINSNYNYLNNFITQMPSHFDLDGEVIKDSRNKIKVFSADGLAVNVKRFCVPPLIFNRVIYRFFRSPKAVRAYKNALKITNLGIDTPTPIAYLIFGNGIFISRCYFISIQCNYSLDIHYFEKHTLDNLTRKVFTELGYFIARLHELGIYHRDFGGGNIMVNIKDGEPRFSLIDINRMSFERIDIERGCENFNRLALSQPKIEIIASSYADARCFDTQEVIEKIIKYRTRHIYRRKIKKLRIL